MPKKKKKILKKNKINVTKKLLFILPIFLLCIFIIKSLSLPALAADFILRPLLGSASTIKLEAIYFTISEASNKIKYTFYKPSSDVFVSTLKRSSQEKDINDDAINLQPLPIQNTSSPLLGEGIWEPVTQKNFPKEIVMARTFLRPDITKSYAITALVIMDMKKLSIGTEAGTYYPGGTHGSYGPGIVPQGIQQSDNLIAVFNGGFQEKDGHYGMIVADKTYVPLRNDLPVLLIFKDGSASISAFQDFTQRKDIAAIRQNGPLLVSQGEITSYVETTDDTWGRTTTNSIYTWRSGIGITKQGNLLYAAGPSLLPRTLAKALKAAGAVDAMQLDINPPWVRFILFSPLGNGQYTSTPLLKDMENGGYSYTHGYNKDFFYL